MVESIASYLGSYSTNPLFSAMSAISNSSAAQSTTQTSDEKTNVDDIFSQIIDDMNKNIENNISKSVEETSSQSQSNSQFGPPAGLEIEGLDYNSLNSVEEIDNSNMGYLTEEQDIKEYTEKNFKDLFESAQGNDTSSKENFEASQQVSNSSSSSNGAPAGGGGGGGSNDEDDSDNPMDLNGDGEVTTKEMLSYLGIKDSYGSDSKSSTSQETSAIDDILNMIA